MSRVLVSAWVGSGNLGDELLLRATLRLLAARGAQVVVPSLDPAATEATHGVRALHHLDVAATRRALAGADLVVFGGGGLVQDTTSPWSPAYQALRPALARAGGVPVVGLGLGAEPLRLRSSRAIFRATLRDATGLAARDGASAQVLARLGLRQVTTTADLALTLEPPATPTTERRIVACLRAQPPPPGLLPGRWRGADADRDALVAALAGGLGELAGRTGCALRLVAFEPHRDLPFAEAIAGRLSHGHLDVEVVAPDLDDLLAEVAAARLVVATRYHGAVAAAATGRPAVLLGYAPKVQALAAELGPRAVLLANDPAGAAELGSRGAALLATAPPAEGAPAALRARALANGEVLDAALRVVRAG